MTITAAQLLEAWSQVFTSPVITELAPGRLWKVATGRGDRRRVETLSRPGYLIEVDAIAVTGADGWPKVRRAIPAGPRGGR